MSFNITTFILEIINFLVLVWLLQKLFYKPVLSIVAARQKAIEERIKEADGRLAQAHLLKAQYEEQLADWEKEKGAILQTVQNEMQLERERQLESIRHEVNQERKRVDAVLAKLKAEEARRYEREALELARRFTAKVLSELASPELERRICKIFLADLKGKTSSGEINLIGGKIDGQSAEVLSAYPLALEDRREIERTLKELLPVVANCNFSQDTSLIAGIKLVLGGTVLQANLKDAVAFFQGLQSDVG